MYILKSLPGFAFGTPSDWEHALVLKGSCLWPHTRAATEPGRVQKCGQDPRRWPGTWTGSLCCFLSCGGYGRLTSGAVLRTAGSPPPENNKLYGQQMRPSNSAGGKTTTQ